MSLFEALEKRSMLSALPAPTGLKAVSSTASTLNLIWTDNARTELGFKVDRGTDGKTFVRVATLGKNAASFADSKLTAGVRYFYRVRAFDAAVNSIYSNIAAGWTKGAPHIGSAPMAAPTTLKAAGTSSTGIKLTWNDNAKGELGYKIDRSTDGKTFVRVATVGANVDAFGDSKLSPLTKYFYRVRAFDATHNSTYSNLAAATTLATPIGATGIPAPTKLSATMTSFNSIHLAWADNAKTELGYKIDISTDGTTFTRVTSVGANVAAFDSINLNPSTKYFYRVRAFDKTQNSPYSGVASATTDVAPLPPAAPTSLAASAISASAIKLTWKDNATTENGYKIERSTDGTNFTEIDAVGSDVKIYLSVGLTAKKKYYYRVRAFDATNDSGYSNVANATTQSPPAPDKSHDWASGGMADYATGKWWFDGVSVTLAADPAQAIPMLKQMHVGSVRIWFTKTESWNPTGGDEGLAAAKAYHDAGFRVLMVIGYKTVPTPEQATAFYQYVATKPGILQNVDLFEIGNEPNRPPFWEGTAQQYVDIALQSAWNVFHPLGAKVVGAGATFDVNYCKTLVADGYLNFCDYADFHPYGSNPTEVYTRALGAVQAFAGKPTMFTEWNIRNVAGKAEWAAAVDASRKLLATVGADSSFYFTFAVGSTLAGEGGLVDITTDPTAYAANQPFFDMFKNWGDTPVTPPPV